MPDANVKIGFNNTANLGYSCGEFDISANFSKIMDDLKDGVDDAVNPVQFLSPFPHKIY
jgi:hypothetical protein